MHKSHRDWTGR